jgi:hypothetical protein
MVVDAAAFAAERFARGLLDKLGVTACNAVTQYASSFFLHGSPGPDTIELRA